MCYDTSNNLIEFWDSSTATTAIGRMKDLSCVFSVDTFTNKEIELCRDKGFKIIHDSGQNQWKCISTYSIPLNSCYDSTNQIIINYCSDPNFKGADSQKNCLNSNTNNSA